jgi:hypothetical protein
MQHQRSGTHSLQQQQQRDMWQDRLSQQPQQRRVSLVLGRQLQQVSRWQRQHRWGQGDTQVECMALIRGQQQELQQALGYQQQCMMVLLQQAVQAQAAAAAGHPRHLLPSHTLQQLQAAAAAAAGSVPTYLGMPAAAGCSCTRHSRPTCYSSSRVLGTRLSLQQQQWVLMQLALVLTKPCWQLLLLWVLWLTQGLV